MVGDLLHRASQQWFRVAILALLGLSLGLTITLLQPTEYRSGAVVFAPSEFRFIPVSVEADVDPRPRIVTQDTEAAFIRSATVLAAANARRGDNAPIAADRIDISVPTGTRTLRIAYTADDPDRAQKATQLITEEYVRVRNGYFAERRSRQLDILVERLDELRAELAGFHGLVADLGSESPRRPSLRDRETELIAQIEALETETADVSQSSPTPASIVRTAARPSRPERSNAEVPPASGLAAGAVLGLVWGVRADRRRDVVHDLRDVRAVSDLPVLARLGGRGAADTEELARLSTEVRLRSPDAVLITDTGARAPVTATLGERLRTALAYVPEPAGDTLRPDPIVLAQTAGRDDTRMLRAARRADVTLVVVRLGRTTRGDLATVDRLLTRAGTRAELVLADARAVRPNGTGDG